MTESNSSTHSAGKYVLWYLLSIVACEGTTFLSSFGHQLSENSCCMSMRKKIHDLYRCTCIFHIQNLIIPRGLHKMYVANVLNKSTGAVAVDVCSNIHATYALLIRQISYRQIAHQSAKIKSPPIFHFIWYVGQYI